MFEAHERNGYDMKGKAAIVAQYFRQSRERMNISDPSVGMSEVIRSCN